MPPSGENRGPRKPEWNDPAVKTSPFAGKLAPLGMLIDVPQLITAYFSEEPDPAIPAQRVMFGTSGHRGSSLRRSFNG